MTERNRRALAAWVHRYEQAWRTTGTDMLRALFTEDATYSMTPYASPFRGLEEIAKMWEAEREGADESFTMSSAIVAYEADTGVVRVDVQWPFWPAKA